MKGLLESENEGLEKYLKMKGSPENEGLEKYLEMKGLLGNDELT